MQTVLHIMRRILAGRESDFVFRRTEVPELAGTEITDLYIHIPFCRNKCPYCPYNTIEYDEKAVPLFFDALRKELEMYSCKLPSLKIGSVYIGGGTPTTVFSELETFLKELRSTWEISGDIAIETNPEEVTEELAAAMKNAGISLVSIGVQSFQDEILELIGRKYSASSIEQKIKILLDADFRSINIDLMFAIGDQSKESFDYDLDCAINSGATQVTAYPLFVFPYSSAGKFRKMKKIKMPDLSKRRELYQHLHEKMLSSGYSMSSVWSFTRGNVPRYSSVTRDSFIGLGPGAASHLKSGFYFNTFEMQAYKSRIESGQFPTALKMEIPDRLAGLYWLYWRLYETAVPADIFDSKFANYSPASLLLKVAGLLGMLEKKGDFYLLTERGAFWIHLIQNHYILNYIDKVWTICGKIPFPEKIAL